MFFATIVIMACSFGPGGCGAAGDARDAMRPQDVALVRKYEACRSRLSGSNLDMETQRNTCAKQTGIEIRDASEAHYHGPFVDIAGKPIAVHSTLVVQTPSPKFLANEKKFRIQTAQQAVTNTQIVKLFPNLVDGLFQRRGVTPLPYANRPKPMAITPSALKSLELSRDVFQEPKSTAVTSIFRDSKITKDDQSAGTLDMWIDNVDAPALPAGYAGGIVGFWESIGEGGEQGFIAYPQSEMVTFMNFLDYQPQIPRSRTAFAILPRLDLIPSQFKLTKQGMTEINFSSSPSGCGESELIVIDSKTHRIMAEVQAAGC